MIRTVKFPASSFGFLCRQAPHVDSKAILKWLDSYFVSKFGEQVLVTLEYDYYYHILPPKTNVTELLQKFNKFADEQIVIEIVEK